MTQACTRGYPHGMSLAKTPPQRKTKKRGKKEKTENTVSFFSFSFPKIRFPFFPSPTQSLCTSMTELVATLNAQVQAPHDPHDSPRQLEGKCFLPVPRTSGHLPPRLPTWPHIDLPQLHIESQVSAHRLPISTLSDTIHLSSCPAEGGSCSSSPFSTVHHTGRLTYLIGPH